MYLNKFVVSVIHDGHPVHETGHGIREVAIPFNSEYKVRLKNKHNRSCTARVFIDGRKVSALGDVIIGAEGTVDLERFIDSSLVSGKKFKFVSLDHPEVDDPTSSDNGIVRVEFRLAKGSQIVIQPVPEPTFKPWKWGDGTVWYHYNDVTYTASSDMKSLSSGGGRIGSACNYINCNAAVDNGATVEGRHSSQSFTYSNLDVEDTPVILKLKMVGFRNSDKVISMFKYCSNCGYKLKRNAKYCSECGRRA